MITRITNIAVAFVMATSTASAFELKESTDIINNNNPKQSSAYVKKQNFKTTSKLENGNKHQHQQQQQQQRKRKQRQQEEVANISNYSIIFDKCQYVDKYTSDLDLDPGLSARKEGEGGKKYSGAEQFVTFRLCPPGYTTCDNDYEERMAYLDEFLQITIEYYRDEQNYYCELCNKICAGGDAYNSRYLRGNFSENFNVDCDTCTDQCEKIETMEENGYVDATNFISCQQIVGDDNGPLYAGPMCSGGSKLKIGVFEDEDCMFLNRSKRVEDYITDENGHAFKLSHALLKKTYDTTVPIACEKIDEEKNGTSYRHEYSPATDTKEICTKLYKAATRYGQAQMN